jgi:protein O-mannosyl-transferase
MSKDRARASKMTSERTTRIGLITVTILAYLNSFGTTFQFDDRATILGDPRLANWEAYLGSLLEMIRPLLKLTFLLDRSLYGEGPAGYHLLNLLLHCGSVLLVLVILRRASGALAVSLSAALLFALHPIQTETVTYISGRPTGMAAFFCLLSLYLYLRTGEARQEGKGFALYYAGALAAFAMALLAKETAIVVPGLLLLWHLLFRKPAVHLQAPFWAILAGGLAAALAHPRYAFLAQASLDTRPLYENLVTQVYAVCYALALFFQPWKLNFDHDLPVFHSVFQWPVPVCLALLAGIFTAALWSFRRLPWFSFGIFWFFLCLLPANSVIPRYDLLSERNLYLPSIGLFIALAAVTAHLGGRLPASRPGFARIAARWACILIASALFFGTVARNRVYSDEVSFWSDAARKSPLKARTRNNLGYALFRAGDMDGALEEFRLALQLDPHSVSARHNLLRVWQLKTEKLGQSTLSPILKKGKE